MPLRRCWALLAIGTALILNTTIAFAQDLGHKLPGLLGLDAGQIPEPGLYLVARLAIYEAEELRDRSGNVVPTGPFNLLGQSAAFGVSYTKGLSGTMFLTMTMGGPIAKVNLNLALRPEAGVDRFGLGDPYIQPIRLGWRKERFDLVTSYSIYLPTGRSELAGGKGVSSGQITNEFSGGGTIYFNKDRTHFLSALAGYQLNSQQRGIDITRGDTIQVQGGIGTKLFDNIAETGLAGYALWQVRPDRGADLPPLLSGLNDRVYGLGPEVAVIIRPIRAQVRARYEWDIAARARPEGRIFVVGINFLAKPPKQTTP
jgi:hypothetical protein